MLAEFRTARGPGSSPVSCHARLGWTVSRDYAARQGQTNLAMVNARGDIVLTIIGAVNAARFPRVLVQLDRRLATQTQ